MAFGDTETDDELFVKFHSMSQGQGEKPSEFLTRLQTVLRRALRRGIVPSDQSNHVRLIQFIKGVILDEMLLVNLHLREKANQPPSFLTLFISSQARRRSQAQTGKP